MSKSITQDMAYRQSLMKYTEKYGVSRASRKYNKSRSYIYFWKQRWDGSVASLACQSRRPHSHPNQHTEAELKLIRDMRRRNPELGMIELWHRSKKRGPSLRERPPPAPRRYPSSISTAPYRALASVPNTMTGPAMTNIFAAMPVTMPSALKSIAGETTALAKPVMGTSVPAPA